MKTRMWASNIPFSFSTHIFTLLTSSFLTSAYAQFSFTYSWCSNTTYPPNSTYDSNFNSILTSLSSDTKITYGFYNFSVGTEPNRVNSLALCRGDVPLGTCRVCIKNSVNLLPQACPYTKEAFGYSDYCWVFVSNRSIYGHVQTDARWYLGNGNASDLAGFNTSLHGLLSTLQNKAASGTAELKFATAMVNLTGGGVLYGLAQCTPDLSKQSCIQCIQGYVDYLPECCVQPGLIYAGVKLIEQSCFVRYDTFPFYGNVLDLVTAPPQPPSSTTSTTPPTGTSKKSNKASMIAIPTVVAAVLIIIIALSLLLRRKKLRKNWVELNEDEINTLKSLHFTLDTIKQATHGFSENNKLGQGGFGSVYKGVLPDGQEIAVKKLLRNSGGQGDGQFKNEILILAKLQHRNLVRLVGYCSHQGEILLVYEFVANRSLDRFLYDPLQRESMSWETRYRIINGIARGILYLHEESRLRIIHRDLKAGNVLLDSEFNPKIADFGMARLFNMDQTQAVASKIVGTFGYMPPEYVLQGQVSLKSDVYSFGVLLIEIISGQKITSFLDGENPENLLSFAWKSWRDGTAWNVVDPVLPAEFSTEILRCIHIGLLCVQENPVDRPTISSVANMLSSYSLSLPLPSQPAFFLESTLQSTAPPQQNSSTHQSNSRSPKRSLNWVTISEFYPR